MLVALQMDTYRERPLIARVDQVTGETLKVTGLLVGPCANDARATVTWNGQRKFKKRLLCFLISS